MAEYTVKSPMWTADKTLYRPGKRTMSETHAKELGLLKSEGAGASGGGEASKGAAVKYPYPELLASGGFKDWAAVQAASDDALLKIDGIGPSRLEEIRAFKA